MRKFYISTAVAGILSLTTLNIFAAPGEIMGNGEGSPIYDLPEGAVEKNYIASGVGYYYLWGQIFPNEYEGMAARIAFGPDDQVYIYNPFSSFLTETWLEGKLVDGEIKIQLPQLIYRENYGDGIISDFYAVRMVHVPGEEDDGTFVPDTESQEITFFMEEDSYIMDLDITSDTILGMAWYNPTSDQLEWNGNGDYGINYEPFNFTLVTPPTNLTTEKWAFSNDWGEGHFVEVGFDGDDVYVKGLSNYFSDSWIKGKKEGDQIVFPTPQYIGIDEVVGVYDFFCSAIGTIDKNLETGYEEPFLEMTDNAVFNYDAASKSMNSENVLLVNMGWEYVYYMEAYTDPLMKFQPEDISLMPVTPEIVSFTPYEENYFSGSVDCFIPVLNSERYILNQENLYYRLYIDGELFVFQPDDYFALNEPMSNIPVTFDSFGFYSYGCVHTITLYVEGIDIIGVQSVYIDGDEEYETPISYYGATSSIKELNSDLTEVKYFDLQGRAANKESKGLILKVIKNADGTITTKKILNR